MTTLSMPLRYLKRVLHTGEAADPDVTGNALSSGL
jgi:hypothetical protein